MMRGTAAGAGALLIAACGGGGGDGFVRVPDPPTSPVVITIAPASAAVNQGATVSFTVSITGGTTTPTLASCTSSSSAIASVVVSGSSCVATGVSAGTASITATASTGQSASATLAVQALPPAISAFALAPATGTVIVGQTLALTPSITSGAGATVSVTYSSSNNTIASVSTAGVVTGVSAGSAVITATAQGSGPGFGPVTLQRTANITVTADPCAPIVVPALPFTTSRTITANSCQLTTNVARRGDVYRVALPSATALQVRMTPNGFAPYATAFAAGETDLIFASRQTADELQRTWHLNAGPTEIRTGTLTAGPVGTYQVQLSSVSASIENCIAPIVAGSVSSNQALQTTDCASGGFFYDEFLLYSTRPCTITMARAAVAGMVDPFLEVFAGGQLVASDDDSGGGVNARLALSSCRSATDDVLAIRATSFDPGDTGLYVLTVTFGGAAIASTERVGDAALTEIGGTAPWPAKAPRRGHTGPMADGAWLRAIGVDHLPVSRPSPPEHR
jgi:hypothetical protein